MALSRNIETLSATWKIWYLHIETKFDLWHCKNNTITFEQGCACVEGVECCHGLEKTMSLSYEIFHEKLKYLISDILPIEHIKQCIRLALQWKLCLAQARNSKRMHSTELILIPETKKSSSNLDLNSSQDN